jgi:indolepyruvate ferredoxin oxidoreductase alpha subunit
MQVMNSGVKREVALLSGNEAIARGAIEAGVRFASGYPGTPASEVLGTLVGQSKTHNMYVEWSVNEKVAFEVAVGAAITGLRALSSTKSLGVNVLLDSLMTVNLGRGPPIKGGLVLVSADDPQGHSSQNEQDNRLLGMFAEIPTLEPSNPQEAKDMVIKAFDISEQFRVPVMIRTVTRFNHMVSPVRLEPAKDQGKVATFQREPRLPMVTHHRALHEKVGKMEALFENMPFNSVEEGDGTLGIVGSGFAYNYVKEAAVILGVADKVSILKLGTVFPIPRGLIKRFVESNKKILVFEEVEPYVETRAKALAYDFGLTTPIFGKETGHVAKEGELNVDGAISAIANLLEIPLPRDYRTEEEVARELQTVTNRTIALCVGCPHRATWFAIQKVGRRTRGGIVVSGDIGCYDIAWRPPLKALDSCYCMGASIAVAAGESHAGLKKKAIATIGDSTFFHSGIAPLVDAVQHKANVTVVVFDNGLTAMTGHQPNPGTGFVATGEPTKTIKVEDVARACQVDFVKVVDPFDLKATTKAIEEAIKHDGVSIVVARRICAMEEDRILRKQGTRRPYCTVIPETCTGCAACVTLFGCPAIAVLDGKATIDKMLCDGCGFCVEVCPKGSIRVEA